MLYHWQTEISALKISAYSRDLNICLFGIYCWELLISLWFEYRLCTRKLPFKWPLITYFLARYLGFGALLTSILLVYADEPVHCHALYQIVLSMGTGAILLSTCNFMIRAVIIWVYQWYILIPLVLIATGQLFMLSISLWVKGGMWDEDILACNGMTFNMGNFGGFSIYTAVFDLVILVTSVVGLRRVTERKSFANALRMQGITYFVIGLVLHTVIAIYVFAIRDSMGSLFAGNIAIAISPIVSCRMVRSTLKASPILREDHNIPRSWWGMGSASDDRATAEFGCQFSTHIDLEPSPADLDPTSSPTKSGSGLDSSQAQVTVLPGGDLDIN